jgi:excisionase family DNA binding protein
MIAPYPDWIPPRLLVVEEVATLLQLSPRQVRRMIADGRLTAVHVGRAVRIRPEAVVALIQSSDSR